VTDQSNEPPDLVKMIEDLRAAGLPIPDDANPIQILAALLAAKSAGEDLWEGFPIVIGDDVPIVLIEQMMEEDLLPKFRSNFLNGGELRPVGFVFGRNAPSRPDRKAGPGQVRHMILGARGSFDPDEKEEFSHAVKLLAWKTNAAAVVFASEAWMLQSVSTEEIGEYTGRLNEHPDHIEVLMVHFEREHGSAYYSA
jgi:hypothetical protein